MRKTREPLLVTIILGLIVNLLANTFWHYLPDSKVHPHTYVVATVVLVVMCILLLVFSQDGVARGSLTKFWQAFLPRKTLRFVPKMRHESMASWDTGSAGGEPAMHAHSEWHVTNASDGLTQILRAYLVKPRTEAAMLFTQDPEDGVFDDCPILPGHLSQVHVDFFIVPPFRTEGEDFKGKIVFVDHLNKRHTVKAKFEGRSRKGELILSMKMSSKFQDELNCKQFPKEIRKKLKGKGVLLSDHMGISMPLKDAEWVMRDSTDSKVVYTARAEDGKLNLYKDLILNNRHAVSAGFERNNAERELILSIKPSSKIYDDLNGNQLPLELRNGLESKGEKLPQDSNISICMKGTKWEIKDPKKPRVVYLAEVEEKELNIWRRFIPPPRQAPVTPTWTSR